MGTYFSPYDWAFIVLFVVMSGLVGLIARRYIVSLDDFLVAGRSLGYVRGIATLASTEMGLITIMYFAEEAYLNGFVAFSLGISAGLTMAFVGKTGFIIKRLRDLKIRTIPEYFEHRFHANIRYISGLLTFIGGVLQIGIFLKVEGIFLATVMGFSPSSLPFVMAFLLLIVLLYTIVGGMHSVVLTDLVQFGIIVIGIIITTYFSIKYAGWSNMIETVRQQYGIGGFHLLSSRNYGVLFLVYTSLYYLSGWTTWQPCVMRIFSMQNSETGKKLYVISSSMFVLRAVIPMVWGIAALTVVGVIKPSSIALPSMIVQVIPAGFVGLVTIGFLAASMSTYDSYLLSFSSIFVQDVLSWHVKRSFTEKERIFLIRLSILLIGILMYVWGIFYSFPESIFRYIVIVGTISFAGNLIVVGSGMYWKQATTTGAYCAFAGSVLPGCACILFPTINSTHAGLMSFLLAFTGMVAGSLIRRRVPREKNR